MWLQKLVVYDLKKAAAELPPGTTPKSKVSSGTKKKTSLRTNNLLKCEVMNNPSILEVAPISQAGIEKCAWSTRPTNRGFPWTI